MENIDTNPTPNPNLDVHLTNGSVVGRFKFKFRQNMFNWIISLILSGCSGHGLWLHYHTLQLEKDHETTLALLASTQATLAVTQVKLSESQLREAEYIKTLSAKGKP